jgi:hypothetical protein
MVTASAKKRETLLPFCRNITTVNVCGESGVVFNDITGGNIVPSA